MAWGTRMVDPIGVRTEWRKAGLTEREAAGRREDFYEAGGSFGTLETLSQCRVILCHNKAKLPTRLARAVSSGLRIVTGVFPHRSGKPHVGRRQREV